MALEDILAGVGGALQGGWQGYSWMKDYEQEERKIATREEIERLRAEVRTQLEELKEGGRNARHSTPSGSVVAQQEGATQRHETPSGNVLVQEEGRDRRQDNQLGFSYDKLFTDDSFRRYAHDTPSGNAELSATTTRRGQDITSGDRRYGIDTSAATQRRGQDIGSSDRRYSTDTSATTSRRGQDITSRDRRRGQDVAREVGRARGRGLYDDIFATDPAAAAPAAGPVPPAAPVEPPQMSVAPPPQLPMAPLPVTPRPPVTVKGGTQPLYKWPDGTTRVNPPPGTSTEPVTPPAAEPPAQPTPPGASGERLAQLETKAAGVLQQFRATADPAKKRALRAELLRLKAQRDALLAKGQ